MCRTVTLIIEFKLLNRTEKIYRLYPLIHYCDFSWFWIHISKKLISIYHNFQYWSGRHYTIQYINIETIYQYFWHIDPPLLHHYCISRIMVIISHSNTIYLTLFVFPCKYWAKYYTPYYTCGGDTKCALDSLGTHLPESACLSELLWCLSIMQPFFRVISASHIVLYIYQI